MSAEQSEIMPSQNIKRTAEESDGAPPAKKAEYLWKLFKAKYMLTFRLCDECYSVLYNNPAITERHADKVRVKFDLCMRCVETNCRATDVLAPPKKKI